MQKSFYNKIQEIHENQHFTIRRFVETRCHKIFDIKVPTNDNKIDIYVYVAMA